MEIIRVENINLGTDEKNPLRDIHLTFRQGEKTVLIGPDGVGKTTLLSLISGAKKITTGDIFLFGKSIQKEKDRRHICYELSFMPQGLGRNLYPTLTVEENLHFFGKIYNYSKEERQKKNSQSYPIYGTFSLFKKTCFEVIRRDEAEAWFMYCASQ